MLSPVYFLLLPFLSVTFGYEPSADAEVGYDYIVQVEPEMLDQLREGRAGAIESNLPPEVNPIRRIRLVVGRGPLPKELRAPLPDSEDSAPEDSAVTRATFRQDIDSASAPGTDLLAQTGPAGGFGRGSRGFSRGGTRTPAPTAPTTVPPLSDPPVRNPAIGNTAQEIGRQLESGFQNAQEGVSRTRESLRGTMNDLGRGSNQVLDNGRQLLSDVVAPTENRSFDRNGRPIDNLATRAQSELRNTAGALRNSFDRTRFGTAETTGVARNDGHDDDHAGNDPSAHDHAGHDQSQPPVAADPQRSRWDRPNERSSNDRYLQPERSILSDGRQPVAPRLAAPAHERPAPRDRFLEDRERSLAPSRLEARTTAPALRFPDEPRIHTPNTSFDRRDNSVVRSMVGDGATQTDSFGSNRLAPLESRDRFTSSHDSRAERNHSRTPTDNLGTIDRGRGSSWDNTSQEGGFGVPNSTHAGATPSISTNETALNTWVNGQGKNGQGHVAGRFADNVDTGQAPTRNSTSGWLLASVIAIGSVVVNLFQWLNIVDIRNKYRVALRRTSPGFTRSAAT